VSRRVRIALITLASQTFRNPGVWCRSIPEFELIMPNRSLFDHITTFHADISIDSHVNDPPQLRSAFLPASLKETKLHTSRYTDHERITMTQQSANAGPSSTTPSLAATLDQKPGVHVHPHGAHLDRAGEDDEEHDYESLPVGAGWGGNMAAGALVSFARGSVS